MGFRKRLHSSIATIFLGYFTLFAITPFFYNCFRESIADTPGNYQLVVIDSLISRLLHEKDGHHLPVRKPLVHKKRTVLDDMFQSTDETQSFSYSGELSSAPSITGTFVPTFKLNDYDICYLAFSGTSPPLA